MSGTAISSMLPFKESDCWPETGPFSPQQTPFWRFRVGTDTLQFQLIFHHDNKPWCFWLHRQYLPVLVSLDLDHQTWVEDFKKGKNRSHRFAHYLQRIRTSFEGEIIGAQENQIQTENWRCTTIVEWATRFYHGYGHDKEARMEYLSQRCVGVEPYSEDIILYGA